MSKKVTVVIPNWNGMKFLKSCLESLRLQDTEDFSVLIIDNASTDDSAAYIRESFPEFRLEVMPENLGFSGGVNRGIELSDTPYVLLLNNDTECDPGFVRALTGAIERSERIFSVSSKMVQFHNRELLDDAGDLYTILGWGVQRGIDRRADDPAYSRNCRIFSACAGAAIYRRSVFKEIGAFDPAHFAYLEDIDLGYRAMIYGYENRYEPSAVVYHVGSGTSGSKYNDFKVRLAARNNRYLIAKNMSPLQKVINFLPVALGRALKASFFRRLGFGEAYREGNAEGKAKKGELRIVPWTVRHAGNYLRIEWMLLINTVTYLREYLKRHRSAA